MLRPVQVGVEVMTGAHLPRVLIGDGVLSELQGILADYRSVIIVTDPVVRSLYGSTIESIIDATTQWVLVPEGVDVNQTLPSGADIILGLGGGRSIDAAKLMARNSGLDWISVPTAASHDGIASDVASVQHNGYRYSARCKGPIVVVADLKMIASAPKKLRLAGMGDILSKASSLAEWQLAHEHHGEPFDQHVYDLVLSALDSVLNDSSLETLVRAEVHAGIAMQMFGSSRPCSGTEHAISHAMDRRGVELHGIQVAFATPLCTYFLSESGYHLYGPQPVREAMRAHGLPTTLEDLSLSESTFLDDIHHALALMKRRGRYSILEHLPVTDSQVQKALAMLGYLD